MEPEIKKGCTACKIVRYFALAVFVFTASFVLYMNNQKPVAHPLQPAIPAEVPQQLED